MYFDEKTVGSIRSHLTDRESEVLFEGRLSYAECGDEQVLGMSLADYFRLAEPSLRADCPELFAIMDAALDSGLPQEEAMLLPAGQLRFFSGLQAAPELFTDIYNCYFDSGIVHWGADEIFVDAGAQDLFTSYRFARKTRGRYKAIYAFEPDRRNFAECAGNRELFDDRLHLFNLALNDRPASMPFHEDRQNSCFSADGESLVPADTLDRCLAGVDPSFIKLHLEGAELAALRGAADTIRRCSPTVAVCVDHRPDDIITIPSLLLELCPEYRLYLRHYSSSVTETVLYAVK